MATPAQPSSWSGPKDPNLPRELVSNTPATPSSLIATVGSNPIAAEVYNITLLPDE